MKIKPASQTKVQRNADGTSVKIFHSQCVKQSIRWQTGDVAFGVEIDVPDDPKSIQAGLARCEKIVEDALGDKLPEMQDLLNGLADKNAGNA